MKRFFLAFSVILLVLLVQVNGVEKDADNLTSICNITVSLDQSVDKITDKSQDGSYTYKNGTRIEIECEKDISGIYIIWDKKAPAWKLESQTETYEYGNYGFLHEYVSVDKENKISLILENGGKICEIYVFGEGILPSWVQVWKEPHKRADLMLLSTHSDDEHLFFAGVLPYYAVERELKVQVVYMTNHNDTQTRPHELLNGLWKVGVRNYPVISEFPDLAASVGGSSEDVTTVLNRALSLYNEEKLIEFQVEIIRRFKPLVIVGHDINGEYKHGAHMANAYTLMKALEISNSEDKYPASYEKYGLWDVPKTYLHLWKENKIVMNWDIPLEKFNGKTAFEVSKEGYSEHQSQQWTWFTKWLAGEGINKASDIKKYSPCEFGLYRTIVGNDTELNDFFENVTPYVDATPTPNTPVPTPTFTPDITETPIPTEQTISPSVTHGSSDNNKSDNKLYVIAVFGLIMLIVLVCYMVMRHNKRR